MNCKNLLKGRVFSLEDFVSNGRFSRQVRDKTIELQQWIKEKENGCKVVAGIIQRHFPDVGVPESSAVRGATPHNPSSRPEVVSSGSGFFVTVEGHIVTSAHVVAGCDFVQSSRGGQIKQVALDEASDLALYIASEKPPIAARIRGGRGVSVGETVVAVGFPLKGLLSSDPIVTTGTISALAGLRNDRRNIQMTAPVQPGNSGGALLGENGSVVGVIMGKLDAMKVAEMIGDVPQNVNFAVSLGTLQAFLNANGVPYVLDETAAVKRPAEIAADASRYAVLLECMR